MKTRVLAISIKTIFAALLTLGLLAGCASTGGSDTGAQATQNTSEAAKNAINSAKLANAKAKKLGYEWRDTAKIIKAAEAAAAAGDYAEAIRLANKARAQAEDAIKQYTLEEARYKFLQMSNNPLLGSGALTDEQSAAIEDALRRGDAAEAMRLMQAATAGSVSNYTVASGDSLWAISGKGEVYGNPYYWPIIYKANSGKIADADLIHPGQLLEITRSGTSSDAAAAVQHAKTRGAWSVGPVEESDKDYLAK